MRGTRCRRVNGTKMKKLQCKAIDGAAKIGNLSCRHWSFFILFLKRQTGIYDASIVLAVIPAMVATNAPARVQRVFLTLTVIK